MLNYIYHVSSLKRTFESYKVNPDLHFLSGYGNLYPTTDGSRVFFCFYAVVGIPLTLVTMVGIGEKLNGLATRFEERLSRKRPRVGKVSMHAE